MKTSPTNLSGIYNFRAIGRKLGTAGQPTEELVPYSEYRTLRWDLGEISGGGNKTVAARVRVVTQGP